MRIARGRQGEQLRGKDLRLNTNGSSARRPQRYPTWIESISNQIKYSPNFNNSPVKEGLFNIHIKFTTYTYYNSYAREILSEENF